MKGLFITLAGMAVIGAALWMLKPEPDASPPAPLAVAAVPAPGAAGNDEFDVYAARGRQLGKAPASWRGTLPDGDLREDADHNLMVDAGVRRCFDYFLSALGEEKLHDLRARFAAYLQNTLSPRAGAQAWALFTRYLDYRRALRDLPRHGDGVTALRAALDDREVLRQRFFDAPTIEAFFGFQDRYTRFSLDRRAILEDRSLSAAQKKQQVVALLANLPDDMRRLITASQKPQQVARAVARMRADHASEASIYQYRQERLGAAAAQRLQTLDQQRASWRERYSDYRTQRQAIIDSGLAKTDQQEAVQRLRERLFSDSEQRRVQALDRIQARGDAAGLSRASG